MLGTSKSKRVFRGMSFWPVFLFGVLGVPIYRVGSVLVAILVQVLVGIVRNEGVLVGNLNFFPSGFSVFLLPIEQQVGLAGAGPFGQPVGPVDGLIVGSAGRTSSMLPSTRRRYSTRKSSTPPSSPATPVGTRVRPVSLASATEQPGAVSFQISLYSAIRLAISWSAATMAASGISWPAVRVC